MSQRHRRPGGAGLITGRLRLLALAASAAAFLLVPAAVALAVNPPAHILIEGSGSGTVVGAGSLGGNPPINCSYVSPGPQTGVCDAETVKNEGLTGILVNHVAAPGSEFTGWKVEKGTPLSCPQENPSAGGCSVITFGTEIIIKATFELAGPPPVPLTINEPGSGTGQVNCEVEGGPTVDEPCASSYPEGTELKLIAVEDTGSEFTGFENGTGDAAACSTSPCGPFTLEEASELDAVFEPIPRALTINTTGEGEVECEVGAGPLEPCESSYPDGTELTLVPIAETGSEFLGWEGGSGSASACAGTGPCTFTIKADSEVDAPFELIQRALTIDEGGSGSGSVECDTGTGPEPCESTYPNGTSVTAIATEDPGSEFSAWSGDCDTIAGDECEVEMDADKTVEATFAPIGQKTLTINTAGGTGTGAVNCEVNGGPTVDEPCKAAYTEGTQLKLIPVPGPNSTFAGYNSPTGSIACTGLASCEFTLNANSSVNAPFNLEKHLLTVTKAGSGTGTVKSTSPVSPTINCGSECSKEYDHGTLVKLKGEAGANTKAVEWSGCGAVNGSNECEVTMSAAKGVTATFNLEKHLLTVTKAGTGTGTVKSTSPVSPAIVCGSECSKEYDHGTLVKLKGEPGASTKAVEWSGCGAVNGSNECEVTISAAKAVTATFPLEKHTLSVTKAGTGTGTVKSTSPVSPAINCGSECAKEYDHGTLVKLKGESGANTKAVEWSGCGAVNGSGECEVTISAAKGVTATFTLITHTLSVSKAGSGSGSVTCNGTTCAATYNQGTEVTLAATAASGSTFAGWSGAGCSGTASCKVTIAVDSAVTATFTADPPPPTCATDPSLCPPPAEEKCIVPKLAKKTLGQAKSALKAAHCALGKVTKPKKAKGPLVVKSSSPGAGTVLPANSKVDLKLGPKPKPRKKK